MTRQDIRFIAKQTASSWEFNPDVSLHQRARELCIDYGYEASKENVKSIVDEANKIIRGWKKEAGVKAKYQYRYYS